MAVPAAAAAGSNMATGSAASGAASTAINAGGNLVGTLAGLGFNIWSQLHQNDWNARQMALQNQWNIDQWNRENAYNTPLAQMQRLQAAGINPALAYSNGQLMNEAADSPVMEASQGTAPQVDPSLFTQVAGLYQQQKLIDSQAALNNANAESVLTKLPEEVSNLQKRNAELDQAIVNLQKQCEEMSAHIRQMDADTQLKFAQKADISFQQTLSSRQFDLKCKEVHASIMRMVSESELNKSLKDLNERRLYEDIQSWSYRLAGFDLENERIRAVTGLTLQQAHNASLDATLLGMDINARTPQDMFNQGRVANLSGDNGRFFQYYSAFKQRLLGSLDLMLSPLKGIFHFGN